MPSAIGLARISASSDCLTIRACFPRGSSSGKLRRTKASFTTPTGPDSPLSEAWIAGLTAHRPMLAVLIAAVSGGTGTIAHLMETVLLRYAANTVALICLVAAGAFVIGVSTANHHAQR